MLPPIVLIILFIKLSQGNLLDSPFNSPKGNVTILASLTDQLTQENWIIKETLNVEPKIHGKIEITQGNNRIQVFYHENDDEFKLVMHDNACFEMRYNHHGWNSMLPTIHKPLLNMALLMGPSQISSSA